MLKRSDKEHSYTELAELPVPKSASFRSPDVIHITFSKKDHGQNLKRSFSKTVFVTSSNTVTSTLAQDTTDVQASLVSPSKSRVAILRQTVDQDKKKRFVEIWAGDRLEASQEVSSTHGAFLTEDTLSSLSFSPSENALLYSAEAHDPATNGSDKDIDPYDRFRYTPQLGEGFAGKKRPTLYLFRWGTSKEDESTTTFTKLTTLSVTPSSVHFILVQAVFASEDRIFAIGYEYTDSGRLLGVKGCFNRPTGVWMLCISHTNYKDISPDTKELATASRLTPTNHSCRSPRVCVEESTVFWLSNQVGGAHASCVSLHSLNWRSTKQKTIVDTVWQPGQDAFPGLYLESSLPSRPFLKLGSDSFIITDSIWGSRNTVLLIATADGRVRDLTPDTDGMFYSWKVLGACENRVICVRSSPSVPHEVLLGRIDNTGGVSWQILSRPTLTPEINRKLETVQTSIIPIPNCRPVETILLRTKTSDASMSASKPCVCIPHGGPHSTSTTSFSPALTALALEGYTVSLVNYTGSLGFGETFVRKLLGRCGILDVQDCMASVNHLVDIGVSEKGPGKQFIHGGSHGGFLAAHLIGQYADVFSAAVMRNPVISCGEISTTDIPDWYFGEFGLPYDATTIMTPSHYATLFAASPMSYIEQVHTKVLLLLGEVDLRVSPTNSLTYYHALKGRGKVVEMLVFPKDSHPLDGMEASRIGWEAGRDWFDAVQNNVGV